MKKKGSSSGAPKIRTVFMGTPLFADVILRELIAREYHLVAVYTQPDKPVGRKQEIEESPVKRLAQSYSIPVEQPLRFDDTAFEKLKEYKPDLIVVAAYGRLLPENVIKLPGFGCVNVHASLLPKLRGASPIQNSLLQGDAETGVTIMLMDKGMDTGAILSQRSLPIDPQDTTSSLSEKLALLGAQLLAETLPLWIERQIEPTPQDNTQATLCQLIEREDGHIFWNEDAETIFNLFRALSPWPGIFGFWRQPNDQLSRIKFKKISYQKINPQASRHLGEVFELGEKIGVQTASGIIFLETVHLEGKTEMSIQDFIKGYPQFIGSVLQ